MSKTTHCPDCKLDLTTKNFHIHLKSKKHLANSSKQSIPENKVIKPQPKDEETDGEYDDDDDDDIYDADDEADTKGYLDEFDNISTEVEIPSQPSIKQPFKPPVEISQREKLQRIFQQRQQPVAQYSNPYARNNAGGGGDTASVKSDDLFSSKQATPILGKSYRENLAKIKQYKQLFKSELKSFKVKKNANAKDLENCIVEIQAVLDCESGDKFTTDAIYHVLGVVEGMSGNYRNYNLTGLTDILKNNIQFNHLVKVLAAKYSVFSQTPPEYIMIFTLASTAYIVMSQNRIKAQLNEPVENMPIKA
jgi:hypothetical protein